MLENHKKTIHYDFTDLHHEFLEILNNFSQEIETEQVRSALGKSLFKQLSAQKNQIIERLNGDFNLVVVGDFKRGKSSLINALLGTRIVTTNIKPETITINQIQYAPETKIEVCLTDSGHLSLKPEELNAEQLMPILEKFPQKVSHINIWTPVEWLQKVRLVDTPGTGDIFKKFDSQVHAYLSQADAVIFVVSALAPLSMSERAFLQLSILPQDFPKVFFVVNMMDTPRTNEEAHQLLDTIESKIHHLFPQTRVFGVSALDELCRLQSLPRPNPERAITLETNFQVFRDSLQECILLNRDMIQLNRATDKMEHLLQSLESQISLLRQAMQTDQLHLSQAVAQCDNESSELLTKIKQHKLAMGDAINTLCKQACEWITEFIGRLNKEAIATIPHYKLTDIQRHYHFFLSDSLRRALTQCLDAHSREIIESAEKATTAISQDFQSLIDFSTPELKVAQASFGNLSSTNIGIFEILMHYSPVGMISQFLIEEGFIASGKEAQTKNQMFDYQLKLQKTLPELTSAMAQQIQFVYRNIHAQVEQKIEIAYQQDIETSLQALQQAQELSAAGEEKIASTDEDLQEVLSFLTDIRSHLQTFKNKLWFEIGDIDIESEIMTATSDNEIPSLEVVSA